VELVGRISASKTELTADLMLRSSRTLPYLSWKLRTSREHPCICLQMLLSVQFLCTNCKFCSPSHCSIQLMSQDVTIGDVDSPPLNVGLRYPFAVKLSTLVEVVRHSILGAGLVGLKGVTSQSRLPGVVV
jgi:hypothetical protein